MRPGCPQLRNLPISKKQQWEYDRAVVKGIWWCWALAQLSAIILLVEDNECGATQKLVTRQDKCRQYLRLKRG